MIGVKSPAQVTRIRSSFLVPLRKAVEKWLETQQKDASEEVCSKWVLIKITEPGENSDLENCGGEFGSY
jgi:hypothetical protein